jgi:endonuclease/exonuclease/phosphatase family metal-dependent hydrolase
MRQASFILALATFFVPGISMGIRLVSFNLFHDRVERQARMQKAAELLRDVSGDIIALQEVATGTFLPGDPVEVILRLSPETPFVARTWIESNLGIYKNGLAILSRYPIRRTEDHDFIRNTFWDRKGFLLADLETPEGLIHVITLHMRSTGGENVKRDEFEQLRTFIQTLDPKSPTLLIGDFNWDWNHPVFRDFAAKLKAKSFYEAMDDSSPRATWTPNYQDPCDRVIDGLDEAQQIDNLLVIPGTIDRGWTFRTATIHVPLASPHPSDHCIVSADFVATVPVPRTLGSHRTDTPR